MNAALQKGFDGLCLEEWLPQFGGSAVTILALRTGFGASFATRETRQPSTGTRCDESRDKPQCRTARYSCHLWAALLFCLSR